MGGLQHLGHGAEGGPVEVTRERDRLGHGHTGVLGRSGNEPYRRRLAPTARTAQIVAMAEVFLGYVMLGGLLSIFSNKMARRAE